MQITDQIGNTLQLTQTPKRIVSLVPSQTELLVDLGLEQQLVGLTKFCVHPVRLKATKTIVGGTKKVHFDKIKALNPDIILCNKEENTKEIVEACQKIAPTHTTDIFTIDDTLKVIHEYGNIFSCQEKANEICEKISTNLYDFITFIENKPTLKVAYFIWKNPWMVAGNNTFINHLLQVNKFENVFGDLERYPEIVLSSLSEEKKIDVLLLSSEPYPFKQHDLEDLQQKTNAKVALVDGEYFSWYGSRLMKAFSYFKALRAEL